MWTEENLNLAKATECEMRAKEATEVSVRRYFTNLARDYRHLAKLAELAEDLNIMKVAEGAL